MSVKVNAEMRRCIPKEIKGEIVRKVQASYQSQMFRTDHSEVNPAPTAAIGSQSDN